MNIQRVRIGEHDPDGSVVGELVEFEAREVESFEGMRDAIDPDDQFAVTLRLFEGPDGYRVLEAIWTLTPSGWSWSETTLYPAPDEGGYGTYTKQEVKEQWGEYFSQL